jgi:hypothetical protein
VSGLYIERVEHVTDDTWERWLFDAHAAMLQAKNEAASPDPSRQVEPLGLPIA